MQIQTAKLASLGMDIETGMPLSEGFYSEQRSAKGQKVFKQWIASWVVSYCSEVIFCSFYFLFL